MISLELAKQLKIAGYPQEDNILDTYLPYIPRLDELIAGCKEFFYRLEREGDKWSAIAKVPENTMCHTCPKGEQIVVENGKNAEDAVALLWMRLKKW